MPRKRYSTEQIVTQLRQAEVELGQGLRTPQVCKKLGISEQTHYRWRMREGPPSLVAGAGSGVPAGSRRAPIKRWCGRRESNPHEPCGPTDFRTASAFAALAWRVRAGWPGLRSGLSLHHPADDCRGLGAARLVSTPSRTVCRPSLARDRHFKGFPEFGQFCTAGFPAGTQVRLKSVASAIPPRPRKPLYL